MFQARRKEHLAAVLIWSYFHWSVQERLWREEQQWRCQLLGWGTRPQIVCLLVSQTRETLLPKTVGQVTDCTNQLVSFHLDGTPAEGLPAIDVRFVTFIWQCIIICKVCFSNAFTSFCKGLWFYVWACQRIRPLSKLSAFYLTTRGPTICLAGLVLFRGFLFSAHFLIKVGFWGVHALAPTAEKYTLSDPCHGLRNSSGGCFLQTPAVKTSPASTTARHN